MVQDGKVTNFLLIDDDDDDDDDDDSRLQVKRLEDRV